MRDSVNGCTMYKVFLVMGWTRNAGNERSLDHARKASEHLVTNPVHNHPRLRHKSLLVPQAQQETKLESVPCGATDGGQTVLCGG